MTDYYHPPQIDFSILKLPVCPRRARSGREIHTGHVPHTGELEPQELKDAATC